MGIFVSLGSNLGKSRLDNILIGLSLLKREFGVLSLSNLYETSPIGMSGDNFYNCVAEINYGGTPFDLLLKLKELESELGRDDKQGHYLPRVIDFDILLFDNLIINDEVLIIPHKELLNRNFFVKALLDIDPELSDPVTNKKYGELLTDNPDGYNVIMDSQRLFESF